MATIAHAEDPVLDQIKVGHYNGKPVIQVLFYRPMQYLSHTPHDFGDTIEVELQSIGPTKEDNLTPEPPERENLIWQPTDDVPLREVAYLEESHEHSVTLYFDKAVRFSLRNGDGYNSLIITLIPSQTTQPTTTDIPLLPVESEAETTFKPLTPEQEKIRAVSMEEGKKAIIEGRFLEAIGYYRRVLRLPDNKSKQLALELTGLAYEKNGQLNRAQSRYEQYLLLYPKGEDAVRVRQRLTTITSAGQAPTELRQAKRTGADRKWSTFGSLSQYFRYDGSHYDGQASSVDQRALDSSVLYSARYRDDDKTINTRFSGGYNYDGLDSSQSTNAISNLYGEVIYRKTELTAKLGRQSRNKGGVLGRFDGVYLGKGLANSQQVTLTAGFPVNSTKDGINTNKKLLGAGYEWNDLIPSWDLSTYFVQQNNAVTTDRQAIGLDINYTNKRQVFFAMLDYDTLFSELNLLSVIGNITTEDATSYNFSFDHRTSPWLFTSNATALANDNITTINSLEVLRSSPYNYSESQIQQMAVDRSAKSTTASFGVNKTLDEKYQINADMVATKTDATVSSFGIPSIPATSTEIFINTQLIINKMWQENDISIFGVRYSDNTNSNTISLTANSRVPWKDLWRMNPRIRIDLRSYSNNTLVSSEWKLFPSFNMSYRYTRKINFELDTGFSINNRTLKPSGNEQDTYYFVSAGYRMEF